MLYWECQNFKKKKVIIQKDLSVSATIWHHTVVATCKQVVLRNTLVHLNHVNGPMKFYIHEIRWPIWDITHYLPGI